MQYIILVIDTNSRQGKIKKKKKKTRKNFKYFKIHSSRPR